MVYRVTAWAIVLTAFLGWSHAAAAQSFGIGPRMSLVRGDVTAGTPSSRFFGGSMRMRASKHVAFELALDYRSQVSQDGLTRLRERPFQGSLLLFPLRSAFAPYVLGGYGIYHQTLDNLDVSTGLTTDSLVDRKTGAHVGLGAEIFLGRHAAFFLDYRFRFVRFGTPEPDAKPINIPGQSLIPGLGNVSLSHKGSMITSGMAFYF